MRYERLRLIVYVTLGKENVNKEFAFCFSYSTCTKFKSCCGGEYIDEYLNDKVCNVIFLCVFIELVSL